MDMIRMRVLCETGSLRPFRREEPLLTFSNFKEPTLRIPTIPPDTILRVIYGLVQSEQQP
jgi:hypothetical protein